MTETQALIARHTRETNGGTQNARQQVIELVEHAMRMERERDAMKEQLRLANIDLFNLYAEQAKKS